MLLTAGRVRPENIELASNVEVRCGAVSRYDDMLVVTAVEAVLITGRLLDEYDETDDVVTELNGGRYTGASDDGATLLLTDGGGTAGNEGSVAGVCVVGG